VDASGGLTFTGNADIAATQRVTSQAFAVSINKVS
jgi:hypothetical protein